jgi:dTDP-4-amino-4,6-dideoxygalactose transaminase
MTAQTMTKAQHHADPREAIPIARPLLPSAADIAPYLAEIDANRWYSNRGPLSLRLAARLDDHFGVPRDATRLVQNATLGIGLALMASNAPRGSRCLMPAWTFVATPAAAIMAGLDPHFIDVDPDTWMPSAEAIAARDDLDEVGAIVVVAPFGRPFDIGPWDDLSARTGLPVIVDAAAAFDALRAGGPLRPGQCPVVVSLHATKALGIGEGGAVIGTDAGFLHRLTALTSFGFWGDRVAHVPGINAKISEYSAAVGLAALDVWPATRARWARATRLYLDALAGMPRVTAMPGISHDWVGSTFSVVLDGGADVAARELADDDIATVRWWSRGCHAEPAYAGCRRDPLPVTDELGARVIGMPFRQDITPAEVARVAAGLARAAEGRP